ncbi:hypothetical protein BGZ60DRAFT_415342 [Tricladium varicosporioides]|nr:hypothetical protein BGZ60DRAFT_415342 [Hymenoscyphus varicosporioides]
MILRISWASVSLLSIISLHSYSPPTCSIHASTNRKSRGGALSFFNRPYLSLLRNPLPRIEALRSVRACLFPPITAKMQASQPLGTLSNSPVGGALILNTASYIAGDIHRLFRHCNLTTCIIMCCGRCSY